MSGNTKFTKTTNMMHSEVPYDDGEDWEFNPNDHKHNSNNEDSTSEYQQHMEACIMSTSRLQKMNSVDRLGNSGRGSARGRAKSARGTPATK